MNKFKKIGILTSGGDAPGMNAIIRAVTRKALEQNVEVVGIIGGYRGLLEENLIPLTSISVSNIITHGGTILYSDRCLEFKTEEGMQKAIATCENIALTQLWQLRRRHLPRSDGPHHPRHSHHRNIRHNDNDIAATDYTIGSDTAMKPFLNRWTDCATPANHTQDATSWRSWGAIADNSVAYRNLNRRCCRLHTRGSL